MNKNQKCSLIFSLTGCASGSGMLDSHLHVIFLGILFFSHSKTENQNQIFSFKFLSYIHFASKKGNALLLNFSF